MIVNAKYRLNKKGETNWLHPTLLIETNYLLIVNFLVTEPSAVFTFIK